MAADASADALSQNELLRGFEHDWVSWLRRSSTAMSFDRGDTMIQGGSSAAGMYLLLDGQVAVLNKHGERLATVTGGNVVGELALVDGGARSADVIAETAVSALLITKGQVETIGRDRPEIALVIMTNLCRIISRRFRHLHELIG